MTTTSTTQTAEASTSYHQWLGLLPARCQPPQHAPAKLLSLYWEADREADVLPTQEQIAACLGCDDATAAAWLLWVQVSLISPKFFEPVFACEDEAADVRTQRDNYRADVDATAARLAALDHEIATTKTYALLGETQAREKAETIQRLDRERVDLLRHQRRDLPNVDKMLTAAEADGLKALQAAQTRLQRAYEAHVHDLEESWLHELQGLLAPVCALLTKARYLDDAWRLQEGIDLAEHGSARLQAEALRHVRPPADPRRGHPLSH